MPGGEIDREMLVESFDRIKHDIAQLNYEITQLKGEISHIQKDNQHLKSVQISQEDFIRKIVKETLKNFENKPRANKNLRRLTISRINTLAAQKNLTLSEIKEIVMEESLCSKATFYRYVEKMKKKGMIDFIKINDIEVVIKL